MSRHEHYTLTTGQRTKLTKAILAQLVLAQTPVKKTRDKKLSKKAQACVDVIKKSDVSDSHKRGLCHLAAALLEEPAMSEVIVSDDSRDIPHAVTNGHAHRFLAVVFNSNPNSHDYAIGEVVFFFHRGPDDHGIQITADGRTFFGNHTPVDRHDTWRYATPEEVKAALKRVPAPAPGRSAKPLTTLFDL